MKCRHILFSETWKQSGGKSFREGSGSGQASLENSYGPGGRKLEF